MQTWIIKIGWVLGYWVNIKYQQDYWILFLSLFTKFYLGADQLTSNLFKYLFVYFD